MTDYWYYDSDSQCVLLGPCDSTQECIDAGEYLGGGNYNIYQTASDHVPIFVTYRAKGQPLVVMSVHKDETPKTITARIAVLEEVQQQLSKRIAWMKRVSGEE